MAEVPRVEDVEEEEEEGNVAKGHDGQAEVVARLGPLLRREDDGDEPEVREDEVEEQDVARVGAEEEGGQEEGDGQDGLSGRG